MLRWLLAPFSWLYHLATALRNYLYDSGYFSSHEFDRMVISVGNLNVGGSGKTPMVEYLVKRLAETEKVATLSRGYGRRSRGFRKVTAQGTAESVGDEPLQLFRKFGDRISVFVGEERALAIPAMLAEEPELSVILLDDAFQHRSVKPQFSILVTDAQKPFCHDFILPVGFLREARRGAKRADVVVVTKCDRGVSEEWRQNRVAAIRHFAGTKPVLFAAVRYHLPVGFQGAVWRAQRIIAVTGIANFHPFLQHVTQQFQLVAHFHFPDHHVFTTADLHRIAQAAHAQTDPVAFVTTEKDVTRLLPFAKDGAIEGLPCFFIPIEMEFLGEDGKVFDRMLNERVAAFRS
jgi:tetraacyldisaccharide 4'-kinase